jgi:hypothetical protein
MRQQWEIRRDGGVGKDRDFQSAYRAVMENEQKYTDIRVPVLPFMRFPMTRGHSLTRTLLRVRRLKLIMGPTARHKQRHLKAAYPQRTLFDCLMRIITFSSRTRLTYYAICARFSRVCGETSFLALRCMHHIPSIRRYPRIASEYLIDCPRS